MRPGYKGDSAAETDEAHSEAEEGTGEQQEDGQEEDPEPEVWWLKSALLFFFSHVYCDLPFLNKERN